MTQTLTEPTADERLVNTYRRGMRLRTKPQPLDTDTRYAVCLLELHDDVTTDDYATLKANIEGVAGVRKITLVADHVTRATLPEGKQLVATTDVNVKIRNEP
jgi:hypothetical protein